jgi:putative Ca2+/H+ antiporter (TMEM165/GDT1 family)
MDIQNIQALSACKQNTNKWLIFVGASFALIATSALGVLGGGVISQYVSERTLQSVAGVGFIIIGVWTLLR